MKITDEMVSRFLTWPVPADVYPDGIAGKEGRTGTNLLTADQARAMLEHVLAPLPESRTINAAGQASPSKTEEAVTKPKGFIYITPSLIINGIFIAHNVLDSLGYLCSNAVVGSTT